MGVVVLVTIGYFLSRPAPNTNARDWSPVTPSSAYVGTHHQPLLNYKQPTVRPRDTNRVPAWSPAWRLPLPGQGAFRFRTDGAGQLVIILQTTRVDAETWATSGDGYGIVLDNGQQKSWVGRLPYINEPAPGSRPNQGTTITPGDMLWVLVSDNVIAVGKGATVGENTITATREPYPVTGLQYFGFGTFGPGTEMRRQSVSELAVASPSLVLQLPTIFRDCDGTPHRMRFTDLTPAEMPVQ